ncbi:MAG: CoA transferase [Rhodospirillaceae bacterium]|nr:CoA transferase [Rhodospirillaceae bacterium]
MERSTTPPLRGIRVVDFTHVLAGPACTYFLASLGADVIKVETVGRGDCTRSRGGTDAERAAAEMSTPYLTQGGGKRSLAVDLSSPKGHEIMSRLLAKADVFVENHRPSMLEALKLDYASVAAINPNIIHCAMTGYGRRGPKEDAPAYDVNIQAACGLMTMTGSADSGPTRTGAPIMDYGTAMAAGFAVSTALFQRTQSGQGTFIDVSMLETAMTLMSSAVTDYLATGNVPKQRGNAANSRSPAAGSFPTKDGLLSLGINEEHQFKALADVLGKAKWNDDPRYTDRAARMENADTLEAELLAVLGERSAAEWEGMMLAGGVPAARVRTLPEALDDPQIASRNYLHEHPGDDITAVSVPTLPFRIGATDAHVPDRPPPTRGEHSAEILAELGFANDEISAMSATHVVEQAKQETK